MESAVLPSSPDGASSLADGQAAAPGDAVVIHPHLYEPKLKPVAQVQPSKQLLRYLGSGDKSTAKRYAEQLDGARKTLQTALDSTSLSETGIQSAVEDYVALLLGLVGAPASGSSQVAENGAAATEANGTQASAASAQGVKGDSPLRKAVSFAWQDAIVGSTLCTFPDAVFELASVLVAAGVWYMRRAASLCQDSASGVASAPCMQANKLLRQAAGLLDYAQTWLLPLLPAAVAEDCNPQVVKALSLACLADCQLLTVLRAVQKGNQPGLIAAIAGDTASLYGSGLQAARSSTAPAAASSKLAHYLRYKELSLQAYAHCFSGLAQWKAGQAGAGLRCLQEGQAAADAAKKAYPDYDKAAPASLTNAHRRYDEILQAVLTDSQLRMKKENDAVFFQKPPQQLPEAPAPKRLVAPVPYALPQAAPGVKEGVASLAAAPAGAVAVEIQGPAVHGPAAAASKTDEAGPAAATAAAPPQEHQEAKQEQGCCTSTLRWLIFLIAFPLVVLLSAVGIVIWIVLLPLKIICCPIGFLVQIIANVVEYMVKAPLRLLLWANGKPWEPRGAEKGDGKKEPPV
ncbi:hypothetical protein N2152v2_006069 [Parachlorella kessleri]